MLQQQRGFTLATCELLCDLRMPLLLADLASFEGDEAGELDAEHTPFCGLASAWQQLSAVGASCLQGRRASTQGPFGIRSLTASAHAHFR